MEAKLSFRQFSHGEFSGCHAHRKYSYCQRKAAVPTEPRLLKSIAKVDLSGRARDFDRLLDEEEGSIPATFLRLSMFSLAYSTCDLTFSNIGFVLL